MNSRKRIQLPMIALTIGSCIIVLLSSIMLFNRELNNSMAEKINVAAMVAEHQLNDLMEISRLAVIGMAKNNDLHRAIINNNREDIESLSFLFKNMTHLDYCTIIDREGNVLARTNAQDLYGDNVYHQPHITSALDGRTEVFIIEGHTIRLGVSAGAPIYDENMNIIGVISMGFLLDRQSVVTRLKEITNCEIAIYHEDERISTTLLNADGTYALDAKAARQISEIVLAGGTYAGRMHVFGKEAINKYIPIHGPNQNVIGMVGIIYYTTNETNSLILFIFSGVLITLAVLAVCIILARVISGVIQLRLNKMMKDISEADKYTQLMFDSTPMCCTLWNKDLRIINCNNEALNLYGVKDKNELMEKFLDLMPPYQPNGEISKEAANVIMKKAFETGYVRTEWTHLHINGDPLPCDVTLVRVKYKDEDLIAGYIRDLREHKIYVDEIEKTQKDLRLALDSAEKANKIKSIFLANMSHEIRTPMNSIIGFTQLALYDKIPQKTREYLVSIQVSAEWLLKIINDILDISKIESGKIEFENIPFDLPSIFAHCQSTIIPKAKEKGISLYCYAEPSIGKKLLGDPVRLRQVLINLLSNAVKFTNNGTVKLLAAIHDKTDNSITINFEVKDSGIGMSQEQIKKIFEPFIQADDSVTRRFGGTGLGLTITKNIIELMGGKLIVESAIGVGSRFCFALTFEMIDDITNTMIQKIIINEHEKPNFKGEVLICEDNILNQQVICDHLTRVGLKTEMAYNGKEGVDIVAERFYKGEKPFDLIFMDIHMPVKDGLDAASIITGMGVKTPIVALTANIMSNDLEIYRTSGMHDYLGKPFTAQDLWKCLIKYIPVDRYSTINKSLQVDEDEKQLNQLKTNFAKSNQTKYAEIIKATEDGDIKLAHRLAHTLKSNAGQINEIPLQEVAAAVEAMFSEEKSLINENLIKNLGTELNKVLIKLAPLLPAEKDKKNITVIMDTEKIRKLFNELETLLNNRDTACMNLMDEIRSVSGTEELVHHIEEFNFKQAAEVLIKLKKETNS